MNKGIGLQGDACFMVKKKKKCEGEWDTPSKNRESALIKIVLNVMVKGCGFGRKAIISW